MGHDKGKGMGSSGAELNLKNGTRMASTPILIVFDCDGTLVDSQYHITEAMRYAFRSAGLAEPDRWRILRSVGLSMREAMADLAPDHCQSTRDELMRVYRDRYLELRQVAREPMFAGAASLLQSLSKRDDIFLGIATGKSRRGVMRFIDQYALEGVFSTIQTADDGPSKPHPAMLYQAMEETGIAAEATLMIGDTSHDMLMAVSAKVAGVGVTWGYHAKAELQRAGARLTVGSFPELALAIEGRQMFTPQCETVA